MNNKLYICRYCCYDEHTAKSMTRNEYFKHIKTQYHKNSIHLSNKKITIDKSINMNPRLMKNKTIKKQIAILNDIGIMGKKFGIDTNELIETNMELLDYCK